jgi:hypothetical protein
MNAKDPIRHSMQLADQVMETYLGDLDDRDLLIRPVPGMNHIAWQLGHLIASEHQMMEWIRPGASPALPPGFVEAHGKQTAGSEDPATFQSKARYLELYRAQRAATRKILEEVSEAEMDRTDPSFPPYAPSVGMILNMQGGHPLMHAGQLVAVRRLLGKPVTI